MLQADGTFAYHAYVTTGFRNVCNIVDFAAIRPTIAGPGKLKSSKSKCESAPESVDGSVNFRVPRGKESGGRSTL